jgi:hypothetical protein
MSISPTKGQTNCGRNTRATGPPGKQNGGRQIQPDIDESDDLFSNTSDYFADSSVHCDTIHNLETPVSPYSKSKLIEDGS